MQRKAEESKPNQQKHHQTNKNKPEQSRAKPFYLDDEAFRRREQPEAVQKPRHESRLFFGKPRAVHPVPRSRTVLQSELDLQGGSFFQPSAGEYLTHDDRTEK